ncbi:MAG: hypothetical protein UX65_C0010G0012 [Parcubacteria group bacterium GW2011_GWB1_46_8]|nr:MAG: hypothetical protein UX65_C0010G0012 [Parcubacteria group bacterium GW2011_GWB1_46_8]
MLEKIIQTGGNLENKIMHGEEITLRINISTQVFDVDSYPKGENKSNAKLSEKDVMRIRKLYMAEKYSQHKLGENFGVCAMTINRIILRKIWKHV